MKLLFTFFFFLFTLSFAGQKASIIDAPKLQREIPNSQNVLLSYSQVLKKAQKGVVNIQTQKSYQSSYVQNPFFNDPFFREFFRGYDAPQNTPQKKMQHSLGSGVIISKDGYIVTNNHVVEGADSIEVNLSGESKKYDAKLIGSDPKSDIAIIKIEASNLQALAFYDSEDVEVGDIVFAIGNPFGVDGTITKGIVSATGRNSMGITEYEDFIQTDASINPGNSGGALINSAGDLIGINAAIVSNGGGNVGIGFAIPSNMVKQIAEHLIEHGEFKRAYLGVRIGNITDDMKSFYQDKEGALILSVQDDTPAAKAGLKRGDLILAIDSKIVKNSSELKNIVGSYPPNAKVKVRYLRDNKEYTKTISLSSDVATLAHGDASYKGLEVQELSQAQKAQGSLATQSGVVVSKIQEDSPAQKSGIRVGDLIIQVENKEIKSLDDFAKATKGEKKKRLYIYREGLIFALAL